MQKTRIHHTQKQQAHSMSSSHAYTADGAVKPQPVPSEDDEDDICPVCESECTCDNRRKLLIGHTSSRSLSGSSTHGSPGSPQNIKASSSLKIKLTVPSTLLARAQKSVTKHNAANLQSAYHISQHIPNTGDFSLSDSRLKSNFLDPSGPKRRGRPPKVAVAAREAAKAALAAAVANSNRVGIQLDSAASSYNPGTAHGRVHSNSTLFRKRAKLKSKSTVKTTIASQALSPRQRAVNDKSHLVRGSRVGHGTGNEGDDPINDSGLDDDENSGSLRFPTFISASSSSDSSASSSGSSDSDCSDSEDAELRMEEESYIVDTEQLKTRRNRHYDRARVQRELFSETESKQKSRSHNKWEIKPRRKSVAGSDADADMDIDTDDNTTEAGDDELDDMSGDDDENAEADECDRDGRRKLGVSFAGVATGWSEGEDSSYDADLFFANLDDSDSDSGSTLTLANSSMDADCEDCGPDCDQESGDDLDEAMSLVAAAGLEGLTFGATGGWDGQFTFSSELDNFGIDMGMHWNTQVTVDDFGRSSRHHKFHLQDADLVSSSLMTSDDESPHPGRSQDHDLDSDEADLDYEDGVDLVESDGETTEDELVGVDGLPNARAMMLFRSPNSVSSVDPMNTLSLTARSTDVFGSEANNFRTTAPPVSTRTMPYEESVGHYLRESSSSDKSPDGRVLASRRHVSLSPNSESRTTPKAPAFGFFDLTPENVDPFNLAIINGQHPELPSPYPRTKQRHRYYSGSQRHNSRDRSLSMSSRSAIAMDKVVSTAGQTSDFEMLSVDSMDIDDVLNVAFLTSETGAVDVDADTAQSQGSDNCELTTINDRPGVDPGRHMNSLSRWDRIPMATFRRTRESRDGVSNDDASTWSSPTIRGNLYASAIRKSNLQPMIPQTPKSLNRDDSSLHAQSSPLSLKDQSSSNIRTVRNFRTLTEGDQQFIRSEKQKKDEKKQIRKMAYKTSKGKAKSNSPQHPPPHYRHQHHQHHPNSKSRASGSMQRSFSTTSTLPFVSS